MGLFTNRKKEAEAAERGDLAETTSMLAQFAPAPEEATSEEAASEATLADLSPADSGPADSDHAPDHTAAGQVVEMPTAAPFESAPIDAIPTASNSFGSNVFGALPADPDPLPEDPTPAETPAPAIISFDAAPEPSPRRRLQDRPKAQAGNVEIDASGLREMLGVDDDANLSDISEAQQRFLADHQPLDTDDAHAAEIKEKIRRQVNVAYASFRLTHSG